MNQARFLAIICNSLKTREESRVHGALSFGLASHWLKNWRESFKPITKCSNHNHVITFDSHLKTALFVLGTVVFEVRQLSLIGLEEEPTLDPGFKCHSNQPLDLLWETSVQLHTCT